MKSVKPGRGPSFMGGISSLFGVLFGIFWTIMAVSAGAPIFFPLFGLLFVGIGIANAVYSFKNATGEHRYSEYDIVDSGEEPDPWERRFGSGPRSGAGGPHRGLCLLPLLRGQTGGGLCLLRKVWPGAAEKRLRPVMISIMCRELRRNGGTL